MTPQTQAVAKTQDKGMECIPFGSGDKIRLTIDIVKTVTVESVVGVSIN